MHSIQFLDAMVRGVSFAEYCSHPWNDGHAFEKRMMFFRHPAIEGDLAVRRGDADFLCRLKKMSAPSKGCCVALCSHRVLMKTALNYPKNPKRLVRQMADIFLVEGLV
jgi:hypothetical protein